MKITVFGAGSRGDIQPCVALSRGLQRAGYGVRLAAPEDFEAFVGQYELDFYALRGDVQRIMAGETGREFMETGGGNPLKSIVAVRKMIAPVVKSMAQDAYEACRGADALVCLGVFSAFGQAIAAKLGIPILHVEPTPLLPARAFAAASWPVQHDLGGWHNYFSGWAMLQVLWQWYAPFVNEFRQWLGLPRIGFADFYRGLQATPMLGAYSPTIIAQAAGWAGQVHVCGYFFLDNDGGWQPPAELEAFLAAGKPPVYIGFGSMAGREPRRLAAIVLEALERSWQRGILLTGWGGLQAEAVPENVFVLKAAPHAWLFPRMAAVVHHGGAGTTAEGLRAGAPTVIMPFVLDQPFWGARVRAMGLGPRPISQKKLTAKRLAEAMTVAVTDGAIRKQAQACGVAIRAEDGVGRAVAFIKRTLGRPESEAGWQGEGVDEAGR